MQKPHVVFKQLLYVINKEITEYILETGKYQK